MSHRVVITEIGALTPVGSGAEGLWAGVLRGRSAVRRVTRFDASSFRSQLAAEIDDFDPHAYLEPRRVRRLDRYSQLSVAASLQALADARLTPRTAPLDVVRMMPAARTPARALPGWSVRCPSSSFVPRRPRTG